MRHLTGNGAPGTAGVGLKPGAGRIDDRIGAMALCPCGALCLDHERSRCAPRVLDLIHPVTGHSHHPPTQTQPRPQGQAERHEVVIDQIGTCRMCPIVGRRPAGRQKPARRCRIDVVAPV